MSAYRLHSMLFAIDEDSKVAVVPKVYVYELVSASGPRRLPWLFLELILVTQLQDSW